MNGNGGMDGGVNLVHKFGGLALSSCNNGPPNSNLTYINDNSNSNNDDGLFQVIKAVEAAEVTIKQQVIIFLPFSVLFDKIFYVYAHCLFSS